MGVSPILSTAAVLFAVCSPAAFAQDGGFGGSTGVGTFGGANGPAIGGPVASGPLGNSPVITGSVLGAPLVDSGSIVYDPADYSPATDVGSEISRQPIVQLPSDAVDAVLLQSQFDGDGRTPGYSLSPADVYLSGLNEAGVVIRRPFDYPNDPGLTLDPQDFLKLLVDPVGASGAILGGYTFGSALAAGWHSVPPAIDALQRGADGAFAKSCQVAVNELRPLRGDHYEGCVAGGTRDPQACHTALNDYVQSCLANPNVTPSVAPRDGAPPTLPPEQLAKIGAVTGILYEQPELGDQGQIFCTAVRIARNWLLTARHCAFRTTNADEEAALGSETMRNPTHIEFFSFAEPKDALHVLFKQDPAGITEPFTFRANNLGSDYEFLKIDPGSSDPALPELVGPTLWEKVTLFSYEYTARLGDNTGVTDDQLISDGSWVKFAGYDASSTCVIASVTPPNCIAYPCQTEVGSSGAPLFRFDDHGNLQLVGVHAQHIIPGSPDACSDPEDVGFVNAGVWLRPQDVLFATQATN